MEQNLYLYVVTVSFDCQACHRHSTEQRLFSSPTQDIAARSRAVDRQGLTCRLCKAPVSQGTPVSIHILPGSADQGDTSSRT